MATGSCHGRSTTFQGSDAPFEHILRVCPRHFMNTSGSERIHILPSGSQHGNKCSPLRGGQRDLRRADDVRDDDDDKDLSEPILISSVEIFTYRGIVEDEGGGCVDRWCARVCGRIDVLASMELQRLEFGISIKTTIYTQEKPRTDMEPPYLYSFGVIVDVSEGTRKRGGILKYRTPASF